MKIKLTNKLIVSDYTPPLIVAEISANHNGSKKRFLNHIIKAKQAGADLIKIQTYEENDISFDLSNLKKSNLKNHYEIYKKSKTKYEWHQEAFKLAKSIKIPIFSSPFSLKAVEILEILKVKAYKVASGEVTNLPLLKKLNQTGKLVFLSSGMSNFKEIDNAIKIFTNKKKICLMQCTSMYPCPDKYVGINVYSEFKKRYKINCMYWNASN